MIIAVDFDGTIVEHRYPEIGPERPGAIDALKKLSSRHKLILWTVRQGKELAEAVEFCSKRGVIFYAVNSDTPDGSWDSECPRKLKADMFIDDANLGGLPDWDVILQMVENRLSFGDVVQESLEGSRGHSKKHRRKHKCFISRLASRCREARQNVGHGGRHYHRHW